MRQKKKLFQERLGIDDGINVELYGILSKWIRQAEESLTAVLVFDNNPILTRKIGFLLTFSRWYTILKMEQAMIENATIVLVKSANMLTWKILDFECACFDLKRFDKND